MTPAAGDEKTPLEACPFCGTPPKIFAGTGSVACPDAAADCPGSYVAVAPDKWNRRSLRSSPSDAGAMREAAAKVCESLTPADVVRFAGDSERGSKAYNTAELMKIVCAAAVRALPVGKAEARVENPFLREVCESLFGCFINPSADGNHTCALCAEPIDVLSWTAAEHDSDCIINRVREHLWAVVPEDEREQVLGKWRPAAHLSARGGAGQVPEGWIAVETRLPDDEECVLIATEDGDVWTGSHNGNGWLYVDGRRVLIKVRHWCPLPAPPADQNERDERNSKREG